MLSGNSGLFREYKSACPTRESHAEDCAECDTKIGMVDRIEVEVSFTGDLSEDQLRKLFEIANKCPVHRTLVSRVQIDSKLIVSSSPSP